MVTGLRRRLLQLAPLFVLLAGPAFAQVPSSPTLQFPYTQPPAEGVGVRKMPAPNPHWVLINAPLYGNFIVSQVYVVDGDSRKIIGIVTTGMIATAAISPDHSPHLHTATRFSRAARAAAGPTSSPFTTRAVSTR